MDRYQMMAFDIDGTLLDSTHQVRPATLEALERAARAGKHTAFCTGRCVGETEPLFDTLPALHYSICCSGGVLWDNRAGKQLALHAMSPALMDEIFAAAAPEDPIPLLMTPHFVVLRERDVPRFSDFHLDDLGALFFGHARFVPDLPLWYRTEGAALVPKLNLYHSDDAARERTFERLKSVRTEVVHSDHISLECTGPGVNKAAGMQELCTLLGLTMEQAIAIGDGENDLAGIRAAGLGIAMGNAPDHVKAAAGAVVSDCDHDGCAEAITKYLLGE